MTAGISPIDDFFPSSVLPTRAKVKLAPDACGGEGTSSLNGIPMLRNVTVDRLRPGGRIVDPACDTITHKSNLNKGKCVPHLADREVRR